MDNREEEIIKCVQEIEKVCKKYKVFLDIHEEIDYDYYEVPYISSTSLILMDEEDDKPWSEHWFYNELLEEIEKLKDKTQ